MFRTLVPKKHVSEQVPGGITHRVSHQIVLQGTWKLFLSGYTTQVTNKNNVLYHGAPNQDNTLQVTGATRLLG